MARTILDPQYANDLNGLFDGTGTINTSSIDANVVSISGNGSTSAPYLSTNSLNNLVVSTATGSGLTLSTPAGSTTISSDANSSFVVRGAITATGSLTAESGVCSLGLAPQSVTLTGTAGNLSVAGGVTANGATINGNITATGNINASNGSITASQTVTGLTLVAQSGIICTGNIQGTTFGGGIGQVVVRGAMPGTISPNGSYTFSNIEIPGFIGYSATTSYVVSQNITTSPPIPFIYSVSYAGTTPTSTLVDVLVMNVGTLSYNTEINFSIIAMN